MKPGALGGAGAGNGNRGVVPNRSGFGQEFGGGGGFGMETKGYGQPPPRGNGPIKATGMEFGMDSGYGNNNSRSGFGGNGGYDQYDDRGGANKMGVGQNQSYR